jgi:hypothetical protein
MRSKLVLLIVQDRDSSLFCVRFLQNSDRCLFFSEAQNKRRQNITKEILTTEQSTSFFFAISFFLTLIGYVNSLDILMKVLFFFRCVFIAYTDVFPSSFYLFLFCCNFTRISRS